MADNTRGSIMESTAQVDTVSTKTNGCDRGIRYNVYGKEFHNVAELLGNGS